MAVELPELAISKIVSRLCEGSALQLAALAGVNKFWRSVARQHAAENLRFDTLEPPHYLPSIRCDALALKFLRVPPSRKAEFFLAAARLTKRHRGFTCTGEAVTDALVIELAQRNVHTVVIQGSSAVTDRSLEAVVARCPKLRRLHLKDLPAVKGTFLRSLVNHAGQLQSLCLCNLPSLRWSHLPPYSASRVLPSVTALGLHDVQLEECSIYLLPRLPRLTNLTISSHPSAVWAAAKYCPLLEEVTLLVGSCEGTDDSLAALLSLRCLRVLELCSRPAVLTRRQLRLAGMLDLRELRLESHAFRLQPLTRLDQSHVDNEGVKALVDSVCTRCMFQTGWRPFKLSLCGAAGLTHDAVSSLLRLPLLSGLLLEGCHRISALDRMRLVAKVKAGQALLRHQPLGRLPLILPSAEFSI